MLVSLISVVLEISRIYPAISVVDVSGFISGYGIHWCWCC